MRFRLVQISLCLIFLGVVGISFFFVISSFTFEYEVVARYLLAQLFNEHGFAYLTSVAQLPLGIILEALLFRIGFTVWMQQFFSIVFSLVSLFFVFKLARLKLEEKPALLITALVGFNPLFLIYSFIVGVESLSLMVLLLFFYLFSTEHYHLAALALWAGVLTNYVCWPLIFLVLLNHLTNRIRKEANMKELLSFAAGVAGVILWGVVNFTQTQNPLNFIQGLSDTTLSVYAHANVFNLQGLEFLLPLLIYPLTFAFPFAVMLLANLHKRKINLPLLFAVTNALLLTIGVITKTTMPWARYYLYNLPLLVMLGYPSKIKLWHIIAYFALATAATYLQVFWSINFYNQLS